MISKFIEKKVNSSRSSIRKYEEPAFFDLSRNPSSLIVMNTSVKKGEPNKMNVANVNLYRESYMFNMCMQIAAHVTTFQSYIHIEIVLLY